MENIKTKSSKSLLILNIAAMIIIIGGVMFAGSIVTSILLALFISIICAQPILWLQKRKVPQSLAVGIVFFLSVAVFIGFGEIVTSSFSSFSEDLPKYEENLNEMGGTAIQIF